MMENVCKKSSLSRYTNVLYSMLDAITNNSCMIICTAVSSFVHVIYTKIFKIFYVLFKIRASVLY